MAGTTGRRSGCGSSRAIDRCFGAEHSTKVDQALSRCLDRSASWRGLDRNRHVLLEHKPAVVTDLAQPTQDRLHVETALPQRSIQYLLHGIRVRDVVSADGSGNLHIYVFEVDMVDPRTFLSGKPGGVDAAEQEVPCVETNADFGCCHQLSNLLGIFNRGTGVRMERNAQAVSICDVLG